MKVIIFWAVSGLTLLSELQPHTLAAVGPTASGPLKFLVLKEYALALNIIPLYVRTQSFRLLKVDCNVLHILNEKQSQHICWTYWWPTSNVLQPKAHGSLLMPYAVWTNRYYIVNCNVKVQNYFKEMYNWCNWIAAYFEVVNNFKGTYNLLYV